MKHNLVKGAAVLSISVVLAAATTSAHATVNFSTFVNGSDIAAAEGGNQSTIAFNYTGTGFVGSVYFGPDNNQLYSTNLTGGNVKQFGQPITGFSGEVVLGVGLGQAGFAKGAVYRRQWLRQSDRFSSRAAARLRYSARPGYRKISARSSLIPAAASAARCS